MLLTLLVLASALFAGWYSTRQTDYFPERLMGLQNDCRFYNGQVERQTVQDEFYGEWFGGELADFQEPSLYHRPITALRSVRFLWLRSFHDPIVVRIDDLPDGSKQLTAKRRPGGAGFTEDGTPSIAAERVRRMGTLEIDQFETAFREAALLDQPDAGCSCCVDGAQWIIEVSDPERGYRYRRYQSPEEGIEREVGLAMLKLTSWDVEPIY
ncbi:hypothetical protein [Brevundimonas sp.]|uniref:hypothetical protein n=1 Tax=Brevundimonas sp. TaxID=1871086 RepID=UPI003D145A27